MTVALRQFHMPFRNWFAPLPMHFFILGVAAVYFLMFIFVREAIVYSMGIDESERAAMAISMQLDRVDWRLPDSALAATVRKAYERGSEVFSKCVICHSEEENVTRYSPTLLDVVNADVGRFDRETDHADDYRYSSGIVSLRNAGASWGIPQLWAFVYNPRLFVPDTRMLFNGLSESPEGSAKQSAVADRAIRELLQYLSLSACVPSCKDPVILKIDVDSIRSYTSGAKQFWLDSRERSFACVRQRDSLSSGKFLAFELGGRPVAGGSAQFLIMPRDRAKEYPPCTIDLARRHAPF